MAPIRATSSETAYSRRVPGRTITQLMDSIARYVPHNQALGIRFVSSAPGHVIMALPYDPKLVGNPDTGVIHGGAITALLDGTCGVAVFERVGQPVPIATLDLRIDYLRPATPGREVLARAECFRVTRNIAFVRCEAFHEGNQAEGVAVANGTFIVFRGRPHAKGAST